MGWVLTRALLVLAVAVFGAAVGMGAATLTGGEDLAVALGAIAALALWLLLEAWRGQRMLAWLRGSLQSRPPRDAGFWGELAYRIERATRERDEALRLERSQLGQFLSAIEASPNGVMLLDATDHIEWCSSVAAEHFGLDPRRDLRQRVTNLVRMPAFVDHLHAGRFDDAIVFAGPLGRSTLSVLVRPFGDGMRLVLTQDITERERADAMRRDFVANVSHEIRTPLTVLAGFVETLGGLPLSESERQRVLQLMTQQTQRMQSLVADLLTLAQLEGSPRPAPDKWFALGPVVRRTLDDATALSAGRHVLRLHEPEDVEVAGREEELASALSNLLGNAVRYTPAGGHIALEWRWRDAGGGELEVIDDGIGIAREHLPRLTERFYRVDGSRSRDTGGTGLGLAIVKHVAQRHGGEIEVHSEPQKGSRFKLVLPAQRVRRAFAAVHAAPSESA